MDGGGSGIDLVSPRHARRPQVTPLGKLLLVLLFVLAALCGMAGLRALLPPPASSRVTTKLQHLAAHRDDYDLIFVGSSLVFRQVDPALFDAELAARGHPLRSFNLGIPGMTGLEVGHVLEQVLALEPARLRWLLVDPLTLGAALPEENELTARVTEWHDLPTTLAACRLVLEEERTWPQRVEQVRRHLVSFGFHLGNVGRARVELEALLVGTDAERAAAAEVAERDRVIELGVHGDGFRSLDDELRLGDEGTRERLMARHRALGERADEYARDLAAAPRRRWTDDTELGDAERDVLARMESLAAAHGVRLIFFSSPDVEQRQAYLRAALGQGVIHEYIDLSNPVVHPELFDLSVRFDWNHLDAEGARLYTQALAAAFAERLAAPEPGR